MFQESKLDPSLDINKLFEEHTIKEIEMIQKQIQHESDRKKIELRTLVGERYRDLIQAADKIAEMRDTSESVVEKIKIIETILRDLQQKYLIGFKMELEDFQQSNVCPVSESVILQMKILTDIPEQIWSSLDIKDFLCATKLFKLAQHIYYSLVFEVGELQLLNKYPLVSKQWNFISQFKNLIQGFCNDALQSVDLSNEETANCLAALVLLDHLNSSDILNRLISSKSKAIEFIITSESDASVKSRLKLCLKVLMDTITIICTCFLRHKDSQEGLVSMYINLIKDTEASVPLSELDVDKGLLNLYLPNRTKIHKPFAQNELKPLSLEDIQKSINLWFEWVKSLFNVEVKKLLDLIISVRGICTIRDECLSVEIPENWSLIWEELGLQTVNFWIQFFQPLLTQRVKDILSEQLNVSLDNLKSSMRNLLGKLLSKSCEYSERDLRWFVWMDSSMDIPKILTETTSLDNKRPLLMKARGFSLNISNLVDDFEKDLLELLAHLKQYLYEVESAKSTVKDGVFVSDIYLTSYKFCDRSEIQEFLQLKSKLIINQFLFYVKENFTCENPKIGERDINSIVIARFLQAIPVLCSNFKECFTLSRSTSLTLTNIKWEEICDKLKLESTFIWLIWAETYTKVIARLRTENLIANSAESFRSQSVITDWERVAIEEVAEEGKTINSEISVPYQTSIELQKFLAANCAELNKIVPHTLPKAVLNTIIEKVASELLDYYSSLCFNTEVKQKQAIQILFDIKYITLMMVPRDSKDLVEKSNKMSNSIISKIDPFDFDVFYPFINTNVKRALQRSLLLYGTLVFDMEQLHSVLGARLEHNTSQKSIKNPPGILALFTGAPWFPPLAITDPAKTLPVPNISISEKPQTKKKSINKEHTRSDSTGSTIKSGAAAFFGAMGSDWFGTS